MYLRKEGELFANLVAAIISNRIIFQHFLITREQIRLAVLL